MPDRISAILARATYRGETLCAGALGPVHCRRVHGRRPGPFGGTSSFELSRKVDDQTSAAYSPDFRIWLLADDAWSNIENVRFRKFVRRGHGCMEISRCL